jgi:hypothetical protein
MDRGSVPGAARSTHRRRKRATRRPPGLDIIERDGHWHIHGTLRVAGNSRRIRKSTELPATAENRDYAEALRATVEREIRDEAVHGVKPSIATAVACDRYLGRPRRRPIGHREIAALREIDAKFGQRKLATITAGEWQAFVDDRQRGNSLASRERYITVVRAFFELVPPAAAAVDCRDPGIRARQASRPAGASPGAPGQRVDPRIDHADAGSCGTASAGPARRRMVHRRPSVERALRLPAVRRDPGARPRPDYLPRHQEQRAGRCRIE